MNLLLDTHIALWTIADSPKLSMAARELIERPEATVWISAATVWGISIKHSVKPANMPITGEQARQYFKQSGFEFLAISAVHAAAIDALAPHHKDPFDRILVAQALKESMRLITHDEMVARYGGSVVKV